ncbi:hypothetical protein DAD99_09075 [Pseudarthrobacter sp. AB1]|nr:hypothetical protein [Pseudarthrobacter sp. AB1]
MAPVVPVEASGATAGAGAGAAAAVVVATGAGAGATAGSSGAGAGAVVGSGEGSVAGSGAGTALVSRLTCPGAWSRLDVSATRLNSALCGAWSETWPRDTTPSRAARAAAVSDMLRLDLARTADFFSTDRRWVGDAASSEYGRA